LIWQSARGSIVCNAHSAVSSVGGFIHRLKSAMDMLVEGFDAFGVHIQYWMPLAVLVVAVVILVNLRWGAGT
jgi:hypothetical protein